MGITHSPEISQNLIQNKFTFDETLAYHDVCILKISPKNRRLLKGEYLDKGPRALAYGILARL